MSDEERIHRPVWTAAEFWGNEAAEDENLVVLDSYFVNKPAFDRFFDREQRLRIARAKKGMGKSALLRETLYRAREADEGLCVAVTGSDLRGARPFDSFSPHGHIHDWLQRICLCINKELGRHMRLGLSDDTWAVVEQAEMAGLRERNLLGALLARLKLKVGEVELQRLVPADQLALAQRIVRNDGGRIWLLIDDIDDTFIDAPEHRLRTSTFFTALRTLAREFEGICVRATVRSEVWSMIHSSDQALDKVHQYIDELQWSNREMGAILRGRIASYVRRNPGVSSATGLGDEPLELVFPRRYPWGKRRVPAADVIHRIAGGRPRWALRLCAMAGEEAAQTNAERIMFGHVRQCLERYGTDRRADLASEYSLVCPQLSEVITAFSGHKPRAYETDELREFIDGTILANIEVWIDGQRVVNAVQVARLLYRAGVLLARDNRGKRPEFYRFEDRPDLLVSEVNLDDGMTWEIHPALHATLRLR